MAPTPALYSVVKRGGPYCEGWACLLATYSYPCRYNCRISRLHRCRYCVILLCAHNAESKKQAQERGLQERSPSTSSRADCFQPKCLLATVRLPSAPVLGNNTNGVRFCNM